MTRIQIAWPDDMAEQTRAARGRIEHAGPGLRRMSFDERLDSVARVLEKWTTPDSPWRRELARAFADDGPFHEKTVQEGLDSALRAWKPNDFVACARRELAATLQSRGMHLSPFAWTAVLAGGGVPMPTILNALIPLVLGSPVLLRATSHDRVTGPLLKRSLAAESEGLGQAFESIAFDPGDLAFDVLLEAPCVVATGSDETIRSISARLHPDQRFVAYGHQFSIGVLGAAIRDDQAMIEKVAEEFALDIARWDQTGCLSPILIYLVDFDPAGAAAVAGAMGDALARISVRLPRGEITTAVAAGHATERAEARMRQASGETMLVEGEAFTVVLETDVQSRPAPLFRFLRLMPVVSLDGLERALTPFARQLSNIATAGFTIDESRQLQDRLGSLGVSRWTRPGRLQTPPIDWPHDGRPLFIPMARFTQSESSTSEENLF